MFVRPKKNASGSVSIQIISKSIGKYKVVKTLGSATTRQEIERLTQLAEQEIERLSEPLSLFSSQDDILVDKVFESLHNSSIQTVGPELVFGNIFDYIGFNQIGEDLFRHLVISRLAFPLSKLKTIEYLYRYQGVWLDFDAVYRFLDKLNAKLKEQVEQIAFAHTMKVLDGNISVVFYVTTLYFEASDEDDLRKTGFSKDGKHQNPQIFIGLLVGLGGYADSGLLYNDNIAALEANGYEYILGARMKNEPGRIKTEILQHTFSDGDTISIAKTENTRLIVNHSKARASKDEYNRKKGLTRFEKQIRAGKLTKSNINNRGYNKYLKLTGEISIEIDYEKYNQDNVWDGLKGYVTNTRLSDAEVMDNYKNLWHIEKAFHMSKTDLRIRPIYHRLRDRIEAHICIAFTAYCIYKEPERVLYQEKSKLSLRKAAELTHNMYQITYTLPDSRQTKTRLLTMDENQKELFNIISKNL